ncbi:hypothetical protein [uncultured Pedobacter sp.]|uniref:hypothetical protein n=1 Tax=uncultured Pedobacter sp. TaxID=246139 RepID=UPI0025EB73CE|nr:hypothetical protein [uncultured Pedobacter sp.]
MYNEYRCHQGRHGIFGRGAGKFNGPFGHHKHAMFTQGFRKVPANIEETESNFIIELFAPALVKENLKVVTEDEVLTFLTNPKKMQILVKNIAGENIATVLSKERLV